MPIFRLTILTLFILGCSLSANNPVYGQNVDSLRDVLAHSEDPYVQAELNLEIGEILFRKKDSTAIDFLRKASMLSSQEREPALEMKAHYFLFKYLKREGRFDEAIDEIDKAITQAQVFKDRKEEGQYIFQKARALRKHGLAEKSVTHYEASIELFTELNDSAQLARSLIGLGISYKIMSQYYKALEYYERALEINTLMKDSLRMAYGLNNIGNVLKNKGDLDSAHVNYLKALHVFERMKDTAMATNSLNNIGLIMKKLGNDDKALEYYFRVLRLRELTGDRLGQSSIWNNIALVHRDNKAMDSAYYYMTKVLNQAIALDLKDRQALAHHNLGNFEFEEGSPDSALSHLTKALNIRTELDEKWGMTSTLSALGRLYLDQGKNADALRVLEQSLKFSKEIETPDQTIDALKKLGEIYAINGDYKKAYAAVLEMEVINDTMMTQQRHSSINEMTAKYEHEKKQQEIELLNKENEVQALRIDREKTLRRLLVVVVLLVLVLVFVLWNRARSLRTVNSSLEEQKATLEKNDHEKEVLLKEIHHRVKNNLQIISSLLSMHAREVKDERIAGALKEGKNRVKSMALIHQMFYQDTEGLTEIGLHSYAKELCQSILSSYAVNKDSISLEFDLNTVTINIDDGILLGLIINELVSNSVKYGFPDNRKGVISVTLDQQGESLHLTVSDDGIGKNNVHGPESTNFGLKLVNSFIKKLKGTMTVDTSNGYKTAIIIPHQNVV
ncbi:MAG: two-component sensor histidine kinase/tetratricopeptide (TPR) repeat protein [Bacteroidia bacterium]|jgi:two-component sensor histidine kinase/tetratricopeptide (TPR) repeat protein